MNTEKLISLKENFTGQKFQWIKTPRPELLGKVVKCRDVDFGPGGTFIIVFDDGSKIESSRLNSDLLMIHGDMQPLTREEVTSIYSAKAPKLEVTQRPPVERFEEKRQPSSTTTSENSITDSPKSSVNMFEMFNSDETLISISVKVKLPDRKLLKMMYSNAENKEKFLNELAEYLQIKINKNVIKESMQNVLDPVPPKKEVRPIINLREVDESK